MSSKPIRQVAAMQRDLGRLRLRQGAVDVVNADGTVDVTIAGDDVVVDGVQLLGRAVASAGVWLLQKGPDLLALGAAGSTAPTALPFAADWANYGASYQSCVYWRDGGVVHLAGLAKRSAVGTADDTIATLPVGFRPSADHIFACMSSDATVPQLVRLDVTSAGAVFVHGLDTGSGEWVSLSGISFPAVV